MQSSDSAQSGLRNMYYKTIVLAAIAEWRVQPFISLSKRDSIKHLTKNK